MGDQTISNLLADVRRSLIQQTSGFVVDVDGFLMPGQIGLELDDDGQLSLDSEAFDRGHRQGLHGRARPHRRR